jgi:hypothetical protein
MTKFAQGATKLWTQESASTSAIYQTEFDEHLSGASFALRSASLFRLTGTVRRSAPASSMIPLSPERFRLATRLTLTI